LGTCPKSFLLVHIDNRGGIRTAEARDWLPFNAARKAGSGGGRSKQTILIGWRRMPPFFPCCRQKMLRAKFTYKNHGFCHSRFSCSLTALVSIVTSGGYSATLFSLFTFYTWHFFLSLSLALTCVCVCVWVCAFLSTFIHIRNLAKH